MTNSDQLCMSLYSRNSCVAGEVSIGHARRSIHPQTCVTYESCKQAFHARRHAVALIIVLYMTVETCRDVLMTLDNNKTAWIMISCIIVICLLNVCAAVYIIGGENAW